MAYRTRDRSGDVDRSGMLFTIAKKMMKCETDIAFAQRIGCSESTVSKIRHGDLGVNPKLIVGILENTDLSIKEVRMLIDCKLPDRLYVGFKDRRTEDETRTQSQVA